MKYGARPAGADDLDVQERFRRRACASRAHHGAITVDFDHRIEIEATFRHATAGHGQPERVAAEDDAEVAAGSEHPVACVEAFANLGQQPGGLLEIRRHDPILRRLRVERNPGCRTRRDARRGPVYCGRATDPGTACPRHIRDASSHPTTRAWTARSVMAGLRASDHVAVLET